MSKPTFSEVIANKGFRVLWINQVLMQLAINTLNFALIIWVFKLTDSNFAVAALLMAVYLPAFLFGLYAGVLVDHTDKRKLIILLDILLAIAFFIFPFIKESYILILLNTFFINSIMQFFIPAEGSSIPLLVKRTHLFIANSLFTFTLFGSFMTGFSLAGPILNHFSISPIFQIGTFLLVIAALIAKGLPSLKAKSDKNSIKVFEIAGGEVKKTFEFIRSKLPILCAIGLMSGVQGVIGILAVLMPSYMERVLKVHATDASIFLMLPLGLGMISGALVIGRFFSTYPRRYIVIPAIILAGVLLFGVGIAPDIARTLDATVLPDRLRYLRYFLNLPSLASTFSIGAFLLGLAAVSIIIPSQTVLQESTNEQNRGKILAVLAVLMNAFAAVPVILAGVFSDLFGVRPIFIVLGCIIFAIGLVAHNPPLLFPGKILPGSWKSFLGLSHWNKS